MTLTDLENYKAELMLLITDGNINEADADEKFIIALDNSGVSDDEYLEFVGAA